MTTGKTPAKPSTIYDVATAAGVSHQTVTRFLRGYKGIRPETQARVEHAIAELGYRPNLTARSLKSGRSHRIGALTHELSQVGPSRIAEGAAAAAREAGYVLDLVSLDMRNPHAVEESLALLTQQDLAGILALGSTDEMSRAFTSTRFRVPTFIDVESDDEPDPYRNRLSNASMPSLVDHLVEWGHRRIALIAGPDNWSASRNRTRAFHAALARHGLEAEAVVQGDWSARSGHAAVAEADGIGAATAVVAANDQTALGAMLALKESGRRVPEDVSVVGIDDIPEARYYDPPLTTVHNPFELQGRAALHRLLALIDPDHAIDLDVPLPQLMVRRSSGPAPEPR
ncbi:LacI family DNA-binding transcriptional regulator [Microbacterium sp. NPDC056234]|uniref:LacI family DNA-binding transcriptional regulator n=1 Tax=Microbacterium sp. NPDC056234 TaxID=3345757 RepID=UPI0035D68A06